MLKLQVYDVFTAKVRGNKHKKRRNISIANLYVGMRGLRIAVYSFLINFVRKDDAC